jgi:nickel transport protein
MARSNMLRITVLLTLAAAVLPTPAFAHRLNVFACVLDDQVEVEAYFRRGARAQGAKIEVFDASNVLLVEGQSDENGLFAFPVPEGKGELRIVVSTGDAHQGEYTLSLLDEAAPDVAAEQPSEPGEVGGVSDEGFRVIRAKLATVERNLVEVRRDLHEYESRVSLDRVLAGVGFILGVTGVVTLFLARRKRAG